MTFGPDFDMMVKIAEKPSSDKRPLKHTKVKDSYVLLYGTAMDYVLLYLLFFWLDLGKLLCLSSEEALGESGISSFTHASSIWKWSSYDVIRLSSGEG